MTRHEFLAKLHGLLRPSTYLEVGVQAGHSLALAAYSNVAIGIDPYPLITASGNQVIFSETSDHYFNNFPGLQPGQIDLAFIDGSHLFEDALKDFANIEQYCHSGSVVVFDDILPYNQTIAGRDIIAGDWTGDVWKVTQILMARRPDLYVMEVDTSPTGTLLVYGLNESSRFTATELDAVINAYLPLVEVPQGALDRSYAVSPEKAIEELMTWRASQ
jgi:cephalosporin hydroxylase